MEQPKKKGRATLTATAAEELVASSTCWKVEDDAVHALFQNRARLAWVREGAYFFTRLLNTLVHKAEIFPTLGVPVVLLDFDVLREHISVKGNVSPRSLAVDMFFGSSELPFAIPLGCFLELLDWLNLAQLQRFPKSRSYDPDETLHLLAERLSLKYKRESSAADAQQAIRDSLDDDRVQIERLLALLRSQRFRGIWGHVTESDLNTILPFIRATVVRYDERGILDESARIRKERRDQRDAQNLSVVFYARRRADEHPILVTNTKDLVELPMHFGPDRPNCDIFQRAIDKLLNLAGKPASQHFPVLSPFEVWIWHLMHYHADGATPHSRLRETREAFHALMDACDIVVDTSLRASEAHRAENIAGESIRRLAQLSIDPTSPVGPFLQFALSESALQQGRRFFIMNRSEASDAVEGEQFLPLARLLQQLGAILKSETYKLIHCETSPLPPAGNHRATSGLCFALRLGSLGGEGVPILNGEIYETGRRPSLAVIRWPVICRMSTFLSAVRRILLRRLGRHHRVKTDQLPRFVRAGRESVLWRSGFVAYTSIGAWGTNLDLAFQPWHWDAIASRFREGSLYSLLEDPTVKLFSKTNELPEILSIRVNSVVGDFVYDLIPADKEEFPHVTVLSHNPQTNDIIKLMGRTSSALVLEEGVTRMLDELFSGFGERAKV